MASKKKDPEVVSTFANRADALLFLRKQFDRLEAQIAQEKAFFVEQAKQLIAVGETSLKFATTHMGLDIRVTIPSSFKYEFTGEVEKVPAGLLEKFFVKKVEVKYVPVANFEELVEKDPRIMKYVARKDTSPSVTIPKI